MTLDSLRRQIDQIDGQLLRLLNRRAETAVRIGRIKKKQRLPVYDSQREQQVLQRLTRGTPGPLPASSVKAIFKEILRRNRNLQGK